MDALTRIDDDPVRTLRADLAEAEAEYYDALSEWFDGRKSAGVADRLQVADERRTTLRAELDALLNGAIPF